MKKLLNNKIVRNIVIYAAIYAIVYFAVVGLTTLLIIVDTGMELDATIYHRQAMDFVDQDDLDMLYEEHGRENVTRVNRYLSQAKLYAYFVDPSFVNTGMTAYNPDYDRDIVEDIELIAGDVWEKGETRNVIVIDERTSELLNKGVGDMYEIFTNSGEEYRIIGVVSNTTAPGSRRREDNYTDFWEIEANIPKMIYLPYDLKETIREYDDEVRNVVDTVIVKSDNRFSVKSDTDMFAEYLEEKNTTETEPGHTLNTWTYNSLNVINLDTIRDEETTTTGFTIFLFVVYATSILFIQIGKKQYRKYKKSKA